MAWPSPLSLPPPSCCEEKRKRRRKRKKKKKRRRKEKKKKTRNSTLICKKQNSVWDNGGTLKWAGQSRAATRNEYLKETSVLARFSAKTWETSWSAHVRRSQRKKVGGRSWSVVVVVVTYNFHVHRGGTEFLEFLGLEFFFVVVHGEMPRHVNRLTSLPPSLKKFPTQFPTSFSGPSRSSPLPPYRISPM